jgi:hypothetical protein
LSRESITDELEIYWLVHYSPFIIHYSPFTIHYSPFTIHYSPFTIHHSLFTIHHSLFTIHYSLVRSPHLLTLIPHPISNIRFPLSRFAHHSSHITPPAFRLMYLVATILNPTSGYLILHHVSCRHNPESHIPPPASRLPPLFPFSFLSSQSFSFLPICYFCGTNSLHGKIKSWAGTNELLRE